MRPTHARASDERVSVRGNPSFSQGCLDRDRLLRNEERWRGPSTHRIKVVIIIKITMGGITTAEEEEVSEHQNTTTKK